MTAQEAIRMIRRWDGCESVTGGRESAFEQRKGGKNVLETMLKGRRDDGQRGGKGRVVPSWRNE